MWLGLGIRITNWWRTLAANGPFNNHATLTDSLISAWPLSEDGFDVHGANDLTNNNVVTFVAKGVEAPANMPDTVANFVAASNQFLEKADTDDSLDGVLPFTYSVWLKTTQVGSAYFLGKNNIQDHTAHVTAAGKLRWEIGSFSRDITSTATINDGVWHLLIFWASADGNVSVQVDNGSIQSHVPGGSAVAGSISFVLGRRGGSTTDDYDGVLSNVYRWSRIPTVDERSDLWNSGDGLFY